MKKFQNYEIIVLMLVLLIGCSPRKNAWKKANRQNTISAYRDFLKKHPTGKFADEAQLRIETQTFQQVKNENTLSAYERYLIRYPNGTYSAEARDSANRILHEIKAINSVYLVIDQVNSVKKEKSQINVKLPFSQVLSGLFEAAGFIVHKANPDSVDMYFALRVRGESEKTNYTPGYASDWRFYNRGKIKLDLNIKIKDDTKYLKEFYWSKTPGIKWEPNNPEAVKYKKPAIILEAIFNRDIHLLILDTFYKFYGLDMMFPALNHDDWLVREKAAQTLGEIGNVKAVKYLIPLLDDEHASVRLKTARVLGSLADTCAVAPLIHTLADNSTDVRVQAATSLGKINDTRAVIHLINLLNERDKFIQTTAATSLKKITGANFGIDKEHWLTWWEQHSLTNK
ncbi:MAG: hypothetical protein DWQ05_07450 [Calditrichaeota bacterium]|nr:MAG: hypothetical protein DWQ05_07450 [Calditrichota bacterium]